MSITKALLIIGGGILQAKTFSECKDLGIMPILVDANPHCYCVSLTDYFIQASTQIPEQIVNKVNLFLDDNRNIRLAGVYTQGCDVEHSVAYCAQKLRLQGIPLYAANLCHNKIMTRTMFANHHIPQPKFFVIDKPYTIEIPKEFKFPLVFKSIDNSASRGLTIVHKKKDILPAIKCALDNSNDKRVLVEEFLEGNEYSIDTVLYKGKLFKCGISDREFIKKNNYAIQYGSLTPSLLPQSKQLLMYKLMEKIAQCFGITNGALKGDLIIHKGKIKVLEVTARLSGGFDSQYRKPLSYGINLIRPTIQIACGHKPDLNCLEPQWKRYSKTFSIFPKAGIVKEIKGFDAVRAIKGVAEVFCLVKVGDTIGDYKHCANRVVYFIIVADMLNELNKIEDKVKQTFKIITK